VLSALDAEAVHELLGIPREALDKFIEKRREDLYGKEGRPRKSSPEEDVVLFLVRFRHNIVYRLLSATFQLSLATTNRIWNSMLDWFYSTLKPLLTMRSLEYRLEHSKTLFNQIFTFAIDGSEQGVTGSSHPVTDTRFYSAKKKKHTINIVAICSLNGKVLWLSPSYPGSFNDNTITRETFEEWADELHPIEVGAADSGFNGLPADGIPIETTPNKKGSKAVYRAFCKVRIIIENVFGDIKNYRICKDELRVPFTNEENDLILEHHQKIWTIAAVFINEYRQDRIY
jgi:hypothetical protein